MTWINHEDIMLSGIVQYSSFQLLSHVQLFATPWTAAHRPPCPSPTPRVYSNSCLLSQWCHPTISSSVVPFSSCLQSCPASRSFLMSQFFASGGQSFSFSISPSMNIQDWFPLGLTGLISLHFKGLSRVFSDTAIQKHQGDNVQPWRIPFPIWNQSAVPCPVLTIAS